MTGNALKCQYNGAYIPVGYKIDEYKHYQIDELTAPFVKEAFLMYVNGKQVKADAAVCAAVMDIFGRIKETPDEVALQKKV